MAQGPPSHPCLGPWRRRTASGAVLTAVALGMRNAVDEGGADEAVVTEAQSDRPDPDSPLELHFDPRGPEETWLVVRPWLLGRRA